jgi:hypothetical protein
MKADAKPQTRIDYLFSSQEARLDRWRRLARAARLSASRC